MNKTFFQLLFITLVIVGLFLAIINSIGLIHLRPTLEIIVASVMILSIIGFGLLNDRY